MGGKEIGKGESEIKIAGEEGKYRKMEGKSGRGGREREAKQSGQERQRMRKGEEGGCHDY